MSTSWSDSRDNDDGTESSASRHASTSEPLVELADVGAELIGSLVVMRYEWNIVSLFFPFMLLPALLVECMGRCYC